MKSSFLASALPFMSKNKKAKIEDGPWSKDNADRPNGSPFSPDSINNPFGAGSPYSPSSPTNPYGRGLRIEGR